MIWQKLHTVAETDISYLELYVQQNISPANFSLIAFSMCKSNKLDLSLVTDSFHYKYIIICLLASP